MARPRHSGAPLGASPESILAIVVMDSGLDACASPRNDGERICFVAEKVRK
jgi:hypothetical protein